MAAGSSQTTVVCPHCRSGNPPGTTSCRNCQRFLGSVAAAPQPRTPTATTPTHAPAPPVATPPVTAPRTVVRPAPTQPVPTPPSTARPPAVPPATAIRPSRSGDGRDPWRRRGSGGRDHALPVRGRPPPRRVHRLDHRGVPRRAAACGPSLAGPRLRRGAPRRSGRTRPPPCPRRRPARPARPARGRSASRDPALAGGRPRGGAPAPSGRHDPAARRRSAPTSRRRGDGRRRPGGLGGVRNRAGRWFPPRPRWPRC